MVNYDNQLLMRISSPAFFGEFKDWHIVDHVRLLFVAFSTCWGSPLELGYPGAEVARYLGINNSCITRAVSMGEAPEREKYIQEWCAFWTKVP
jgi:hypothetical protein